MIPLASGVACSLDISLAGLDFVVGALPFLYKHIDSFAATDLERLANSEGNGARYDALKRRIQQTAIPGAFTFQSSSPSYQLPPPPTAQPSPSQARPASLGSTMTPHASSHGSIRITFTIARVTAELFVGRLVFKESPFFTIVAPLTSVMECKGMPQACTYSLHTVERVGLICASPRTNKG